MNKLISVIIPTYNRITMLKEAVISVLKQKYVNIEIIVIDDNSKCNNEEMILELNDNRVRYYRNEKNLYASESRRIGYQLSKGEYIVFMDDDDYYTDFDFFKKSLEIIETTDVSFVSGNARHEYINTNKISITKLNVSGFIERQNYFEEFQLSLNKPLSTFTTVFSRKILEDTYLKNAFVINDSTIYLRCLTKGNAYILDTVIGNYRIHDCNISNNINFEFVKQVLKEKYFLSMYNEYSLVNAYEWWNKQLLITLKYNFYGSKVRYNQFKEILKFLNYHFPYKKSAIFLIYIKSLIKRRGVYK